jgi:hypothetical protein
VTKSCQIHRDLGCAFLLAFAAYIQAPARAFGWEAPSNEEWIGRQLASGNTADLGLSPYGRTIRAEYLSELLSGTNLVKARARVHIRHACVFGTLDLSQLGISQECLLDGCVFEDRIDLTGTHFLKDLTLSASHFKNDFIARQIKIEGNFNLSRSTFLERVDLTHASVSGNLMADEIETHGPFTIELANIGTQASFSNSLFEATATFRGMNIGDKLLGVGSQFFAKADFESIKIAASASFYDATFSHVVNMGYAQIQDELSFEKAEFRHPTTNINFYGLKVGGAASFISCTFAGPLEFSETTVAKDLWAWDTRFLNSHQIANFTAMSVGGSCYFDRSEFLSPVSFILATIDGNFYAPSVGFNNPLCYSNLTNSTGGKLHHNVDFGSMKVRGFGIFAGAHFQNLVSLRNADFGYLQLENITWPNDPSSVRLHGLTYRHIRGAPAAPPVDGKSWVNQTESWKSLKANLLGRKAEYSADVFQNVEDYFNHIGEPTLAKKVFVERKKQERSKLWQTVDFKRGLGLTNLPTLAWDWFLWLVVRNGSHPEFALYYSAVFVLIGCRVFQFENMERRTTQVAVVSGREAITALDAGSGALEAESALQRWRKRIRSVFASKTPEYHAFWYSLDQYVPIIELKANDDWAPNPRKRLAWNYLTVHKLIGALLVPIGLASVTGLIK